MKNCDTKTVAELARCVALYRRSFHTVEDPVRDFFKTASLVHQQQFFSVVASHMPLSDTKPLFLLCSAALTDIAIAQEPEQPPLAGLLDAFESVKNLTLKKIPLTSIQSCTQLIPSTVESLDLSQSAPLLASDLVRLLHRLPALTHLKIALSDPNAFNYSGGPLKSLSIECPTPLPGLERFSALTQLSLIGPTLSEKSFSSISQISGLQELTFYGNLQTPQAILPLKKLHQLTSLKIISEQLYMPAVHEVLKNKTSIRAVSFSFSRNRMTNRAFTAADCMQIAHNCQNLTSLCLPDSLDATDAELCAFFTHMKSRPLTKLNLTLPPTVNKKTISLLFDNISLQSLHLQSQTDVFNQHFKIFNITSLSITQHIENPFLLSSLRTLFNLKDLYLSLPFTDHDATNVYLAPALHTFIYKYEQAPKFTDHGFKILCSSSSLRQIDIQSATKLTRSAVMCRLKESPHITYCRVLSPRGTNHSYDPADGLYPILKLIIPVIETEKAIRIFESRHITHHLDI